MFPFDNNSTADNPPHPESLLLKRSSSSSSSHFHSHPDHDHHHHHHHLQNPNPPPFFSNFPSPFFDEHELPLHQMLVDPSPDPIEKPEPSPERVLVKTAKRKRSAGKKDRHSKICTAHGIRDRRMRLSLQVARKFFDIQDMLGYDKASATIEWLFSKSKQAIKELVAAKRQAGDDNGAHFTLDFSGKSDSFSSECEVVSGVAHEVMKLEKNALGQVLAKKKSWKINRGRPNDSVRESRERARARARWRTREKMMFKRQESGSSLGWANCVSSLQSDRHDLDQKLGFSIDQEFSGNYHTASSLLLSQDRDAGTIEKLLGNSSLSSASNLSPISDNNNNNNNYQCCIDPSSSNLMGFIGDWEMLNNVTNQQVSSVAGNSNDNSVITTHNFPLFPQ